MRESTRPAFKALFRAAVARNASDRAERKERKAS
jgi:hypothetical protein